MLAIWQKAGKPSSVLDRNEEAPLKRLAVALKRFLQKRRAQFVAETNNAPLLEWYGTDTTPLRVENLNDPRSDLVR